MRNMELLRAFRRELRQPGEIKLFEVVHRAVNSPTSRFWVSEDRAFSVISSMKKGKSIENMIATKREMYTEIYARVTKLMEEKTGISLIDAVTKVVNSPAPQFYLTVGSAVVILHHTKKLCRAKIQDSTRI